MECRESETILCPFALIFMHNNQVSHSLIIHRLLMMRQKIYFSIFHKEQTQQRNKIAIKKLLFVALVNSNFMIIYLRFTRQMWSYFFVMAEMTLKNII